GIVGGLYSIGYSGLEIEKLSLRDDWQEIFTDKPERKLLPYFQKKETGKYQVEFGMDGLKPVAPSGLIYGQKISLLFSSMTFPYERITNFDNLPIPYRSVAVDLITGEEVILKEGSLAKAMRATMAIPTVFSPVELGDSLLIDGGILNNLPVDVALEMGADIIIAVDLGYQEIDREDMNSAITIMNQTLSMVNLEKRRRNMKDVDILIQPNMTDYTPADFSNQKIRGILHEGKIAAENAVSQLLALKKQYEYLDILGESGGLINDQDWRIHSIQITGNTSVPFQFIYNQLGQKVNDPFDPAAFKNTVAEMKMSDVFQDVSYELIPESEGYVSIHVQVKERQRPVIHGITIEGNKTLPFSFIYRLLGYEPGQRLDVDELNRRLMEMYGLGYFERLWYDIVPVNENQIELQIRLTELPLRKVKVGLRYNDLYKLVGIVGGQATNLLIPGLRLEAELQFAGLSSLKYKAFYPSRALNLPIYPYLQYSLRSIPVLIYDAQSTKIASYNDRGANISAGLGIVLAKAFNLEVGYQLEKLDIHPEIGVNDPATLPSFTQQLRQVKASLNFDTLDDVLLPRRGALLNATYERAFERFGSDLSYTTMKASVHRYLTVGRKNTFHLYGYWTESSETTPIPKYMYIGGPGSFVGVDYNQLIATRMNVVGLEYRYEYKKDIFFKLMANTAFNVYYIPGETYEKINDLVGFGVGAKFLSPVGPLEIVFSYGDKNFIGSQKWRSVNYINIGYKF
ncbi:MAG: BamA/TamA family outer membrane protein, partial [Candidatus Marinimicrobia bacterium]|nr:BamA/TamA family outer membrane protein [Candidatus Neomarinimicrobiota bacterium]